MAEAVAATPSAEPDVPYLIVHTHGHTVSSAHAHDALHAHTLTVLHSHPLRCPAPACLPQSLPPGRTGTHNPRHHSLHGPQPHPFTRTPMHEDNAWALLPRPTSHVRAPLHNLPRHCSQTDSQMQRARAHTHSPAYIPTTFSHACVHTHILSEPPSHHHFPSSVSHKHSLCQEGGSAAEQPPKCLSLFCITSSLASGSSLPPPDPQTGASCSSVISLLFNNNTQCPFNSFSICSWSTDHGLSFGNTVETGFPGGSAVKNLPAVQETRVRSLGWEDPLWRRAW